MSNRDLDTLEQDLDRNRDRIAGLVDELTTKLQPAELARQGLQSQEMRTAISAAKATWKQNPVACGLAALALGYVAYQGAITFADIQKNGDSRKDPGPGNRKAPLEAPPAAQSPALQPVPAKTAAAPVYDPTPLSGSISSPVAASDPLTVKATPNAGYK
ncbi:DUF3618 domain-containing protein [Roseibium sp. CAU 1637]|uniref:DUF3618 domain-containing protein n=1 Tax=Roseibium limicola TaxID=2816037 RepID=A0A939ESZ3_9HYPH|nr:DUF3618 domain-containing protein [Roseibium limicola]MBO0347341.1 DUF3618 domain-containing protein [Roseibium limicola]